MSATTSSHSLDDGPRQLKRRRTALDSADHADPEVSPPTQTSRSETVWMSDGNIILQSRDGTQFRVHKSVLALNSSFFQDMFSVVDDSPQVNEAEKGEWVDGYAVVRLSEDDSKEDWERVLQLVYNPAPSNTTASPAPAPDLAAIHRMLVFTNKYQFDGLFNDVLNTLSTGFPYDLHSFTRRYHRHMEGIFECYRVPCSMQCGTWACQVNPLLDVIDTALRLGGACKKILPVAMYLAMIGLKFSELRDDKKIANRDVRDRLINAREAMRVDLFDQWHPWLSDPEDCAVVPAEQCTRKASCKDIRMRADGEFLRCVSSSSGEVFLYALRDLPLEQLFTQEIDDFREHLCPECLKQLAGHYKQCRMFMFASLPGYFRLGTWKKLGCTRKEDE